MVLEANLIKYKENVFKTNLLSHDTIECVEVMKILEKMILQNVTLCRSVLSTCKYLYYSRKQRKTRTMTKLLATFVLDAYLLRHLREKVHKVIRKISRTKYRNQVKQQQI